MITYCDQSGHAPPLDLVSTGFIQYVQLGALSAQRNRLSFHICSSTRV